MRNKLKNMALFIAGVMLVTNLSAQVPIIIADFSVVPSTVSSGQADSVNLSVSFAMNNVNLATGVVLRLGTARDSGNVFVAHPVFNTSGGITTLSYKGVTKIINIKINFDVKISKEQYNSYTNATLFIETPVGVSRRYYYNK